MWSCCLLATLLAPLVAVSDDDGERRTKTPTIAERIDGLTERTGLLSMYLDEREGAVLIALPAPDPRDRVCAELIYVDSLSSGLGSNPIGLDRGQLGDTRVVRFVRLGRKVLIEQINPGYRALSDRVDERRAVSQSFAPSVLWGDDVAALDEDGRCLVDLAPFLLRDAHAVSRTLKSSDQGAYSLDDKRSAIDASSCLVFPRNIELEAMLTYVAKDDAGPLVRGTAADGDAFTLRQHHSFVALPDDAYQPRVHHPECGFGAVTFLDYAAPLDGALRTSWIERHRLRKVDPTAAVSRAVSPIVYYVDRGAPPAIREALIEGASWWAAAFEAAGFRDAFRVELLPEDAHPLDVRYHVIHWVHRSTRGWSYGGGVTDPRTGEILKGNVLLGSLRVRQDRLLFEGLLTCADTGRGGPADPVEIALSRVRQLAAHEVGHTLGLSHNFAASTYGRASVMDYPAPLVTLTDAGDVDASQAYGSGVGAWDVQAIRYGYSEFAPGDDETAALLGLVESARRRGLLFLTDADARPAGAAHPLANLWDNGADPVAELRRLLDVRRVAIDRFGAANLPVGRPLAELQEVFVPVYLHHRFQVLAAAKSLGGVEYSYARREAEGDPAVAAVVAAERQSDALDALLECLRPDRLDVPDRVARLLLPRPPGTPRNRELFTGHTDPTFDTLGAAAAAADLVVSAILQRDRVARLIDQRRRDLTQLGFEDVCERLTAATFMPAPAPRLDPIAGVVQSVVVDRWIGLAMDRDASPAVRAVVDGALRRLHRDVLNRRSDDHARRLSGVIELYFARAMAAPPVPPTAPVAPPGDPIGACGED